MYRLIERPGLKELIVNNSLVHVFSLKPKALDFSIRPTFGLRCVIGTDGLEGLLQKRLSGLSHSQDRSSAIHEPHLPPDGASIYRCISGEQFHGSSAS
jgi:hypothetical protein